MLFIVLASRLELSPEILASIGWPSLLFVAVLIVVVRPLAAMLATLGSELTWRERLLVCWIHPRGIVAAAVASLFALKLRDTRFAVEAQQFVFVTFAVIFGTVFVYGFTMGPLARRLGLSRSSPQGIMFVGASPWVRELALAVQAEEVPVLLVDNNPQKISAARLAGLPVCLGSIGSEFVQEQLDLGDIGRLIAATPNDEVNTFASMEFVENFGRAGVFQLAPREASHQRYERIPTHLRGRLLFSKEATFDQLEKRFHDGQQIKKTVLTEEFTFEHFRERYGESALIVFVVDENDRLQIRTAGDTTVPKPDQKVIALVHEVENLS
jgi:Trk K+ transport system NAD-binding subunit